MLTPSRRRYALAFLFVLPALLNFALFRYVPILMAAQASLYEYSLLGGFGDFVGLRQFARALDDALFRSSLWVSVLFALMKVPAQVALSILLALFVSRDVRGMGLARTALFVPVVTSLVVGAMLWSMMLNRDLGLLQSLLEALGVGRTAFLSSSHLALPSLAAMMVWKEVGFSTIVFVAGLKAIPGVFYEAAAIDGAGPVRRFFVVTLPLLRPVTLFVAVTQTVSALQVFVPVYVMTDGGPFFATNAVVFYVYQNGFRYSDMGYASAMSFLVLVLLVFVSLGQFRLLRGRAEY